jgi:hypothetical protein
MFGEIVFTPCSWGPQMVPSNYGLTETCRSALFRCHSAVPPFPEFWRDLPKAIEKAMLKSNEASPQTNEMYFGGGYT